MKRSYSIILCVILLSACATTRPFSNSLPKNLNIQTRAESGSVFSSLNIFLDIYKFDSSCHAIYEGTVSLKNGLIQVGLPKNSPSYLIFRFESGGFLGGSSGSTEYASLLKPLKGRLYEAEVGYIENLCNVEITQVLRGRRKTIDDLPLDACKKLTSKT